MDASVIRAMTKWPNVPAVYGWLSLDRRGRWSIKGEPVRHARIRTFINANYAADERGSWYFQNGPQRVYVQLAYTPWIYELAADHLLTHTGHAANRLESVWLDEDENLLFVTELGPGILHDRDLVAASDRFLGLSGSTTNTIARLSFQWHSERFPVGRIEKSQVPDRFGFAVDPKPTAGS